MAVTTYQDIYGWETGLDYGIVATGASLPTAQWVLDGTAHTGCYYGRCLLRSTSGDAQQRVFSPPLKLPANGTSSFDAVARLWVRIPTAPDQNQTAVVNLGNGGAALPIDLTFRVNTDLTWEMANDFALPTTVTGGPALPLNTWFLLTLTLNWKRTADVSDKVVLTITANGTTLTSGILTFGNLLASQPQIDRVSIGSTIGGGGGSLTVGEAHFDDLTLQMQFDSLATTASVTLPTADRIRLVPVTGQSAQVNWAGSVADVQDLPVATAGPGQTSSTVAALATFTHSTGLAIGVGSVQVFKVYAHLKASIVGPTTQQIQLLGTDYPVSITDTYQTGANTPMAVDWAPVGFDGTTFGVINSTGASLTLGAIHGEVLYGPTASNWFGCGVDPNPPSPPVGGSGCTVTLFGGSDSAGGHGCRAAGFAGSDSGGGHGCGVTL